MTDSPVELLSLEVPCNASAPGAVRQAFGGIDSFGWVLADILLVVSELVTNAVLHSGCVHDDTLKISALLASDRMTISVLDPGASGQEARPGTDDGIEHGGWGLRIVEQLAQRWGAERDNGYRVWAEVPLTQ